jgi:hypothetical protein
MSGVEVWLHSFFTWALDGISEQLYARGKNPRYTLNRRLGGPQNGSVRFREQKNRLPMLAIKTPFLGLATGSLVHVESIVETSRA